MCPDIIYICTILHASYQCRHIWTLLPTNVFYYLRNITIIRHILSEEECNITVISRLDYCNVLLCGLPKKTLHILQRVQKYAARLIRYCGLVKVRHNTCTLLSSNRVAYVGHKMLLYTYKVLHVPPYVWDCNKILSRRQLRSSGKCMLVFPKIRTNRYGARSFLYASAMLLFMWWSFNGGWFCCSFQR